MTTPAIATGALGGAIDQPSVVERPPIVEVNGTRLSRAQFVDVLVQSHGLELVESVIVREAARQLAEERGIEVTRDDIHQARDAAIVRLAGPAGNTGGVGAVVRVRYDDGTLGPARLVTAGSGYWSQSSRVPVMGRDPARKTTGIVVYWSGKEITEVTIPDDTSVVVVAYETHP